MGLKNSEVVFCFRSILLLCGYAAWCNSTTLDKTVEQIWDALRQNWLFRLDSFEPFAVTLSFYLSFTFYHILDKHTSFASQWKIQKKRENEDEPKDTTKRRLRNEVFYYWAPIALFDILYPRRNLPIDSPSFFTLFFEVIAGIILYDTFFFIFHVAFHKVPFLYKLFHAKHHQSKTLRAIETIRLSFVEEMVDVACSIAALSILQCHPLSRAVYNIVIVYLITELHSGYDMPWMLQTLVPFDLWGGSRRHHFHHLYGTKYYSKFFTPLDSLYDYFTHFFAC